MNAHKMSGDQCQACGQRGLELEDECPVTERPPTPKHGEPEQRAIFKALVKARQLRPTPKRKSFNESQNLRCLDAAARDIKARLALKSTTRPWTGEELRLILTAHSLDVRHEDQFPNSE